MNRWTALVATLAAVALLSLAGTAQALSTPAPVSAVLPLVAEGEEEDESEAEEGEESEAEECEAEPGEECEAESSAEAPEECLLRSATASVSAKPNSGKVRLVVRYSAFSPASVEVGYRLHGAKGSLSLGTATARFGRSGVFRKTKHLGKRQMAKVMVAREFAVQLHAVNTPSYCRRLFSQRLTVRQAVPGGLLWLARATG